MQTKQTQHRVSEQLQDIHPYTDPPFTSAISPEQVATAFGTRSIPKYAQVLAYPQLQDPERIRALNDVQEILSNQELKKTAVKENMVEITARLLMNPNGVIRRSAAQVLACLVLDTEGRKRASDHQILANLNTLLSNKNKDVVEASALAICNFALFRDGVAAMALKNVFTEKLVSLLDRKSASQCTNIAMKYILQTTMHMTKHYTLAMSAVECKIIPNLIDILKHRARYTPDMLLSVAHTIWNLSTHDCGKEEAIEEHVVEHISKLLAAVHTNKIPVIKPDVASNLIRACSGALMSIGINENAKGDLVDHSAEALIACLYCDDEAIRSNAIAAINSASDIPRGVKRLVTLLVPKTRLLLEVFGNRSIRTLNELFDEGTVGTRSLVLDALERLTASPEAVREVSQSLHLIDRLARAIEDEENTIECKHKARVVLQNILLNSDIDKKRVVQALESAAVSKEHVDAILSGTLEPAKALPEDALSSATANIRVASTTNE